MVRQGAAHYQLTRLKYTAVYCSTAVVKDLQWNTASTTTLLHLSAVYTSSKREVLGDLKRKTFQACKITLIS